MTIAINTTDLGANDIKALIAQYEELFADDPATRDLNIAWARELGAFQAALVHGDVGAASDHLLASSAWGHANDEIRPVQRAAAAAESFGLSRSVFETPTAGPAFAPQFAPTA